MPVPSPRPSAPAAEVFHALKSALKGAGHNTNVGDEGGFAPNLKSSEQALDFVLKAIEEAGYKPGEDVTLALDAASSEFFKDGKYVLAGEKKTLDSKAMVKYYAKLVANYPIASIEDGMAEDDWEGWKLLTEALGGQTPVGRRRSVCDQSGAFGRWHPPGRGQFDPGQGQPDRHPVRDPGSRRIGA